MVKPKATVLTLGVSTLPMSRICSSFLTTHLSNLQSILPSFSWCGRCFEANLATKPLVSFAIPRLGRVVIRNKQALRHLCLLPEFPNSLFAQHDFYRSSLVCTDTDQYCQALGKELEKEMKPGNRSIAPGPYVARPISLALVATNLDIYWPSRCKRGMPNKRV